MENTSKSLAETINSLSIVITDMKKVIEELISENKKLRLEIERMKSEKQQINTVNTNFDDAVEEAMDRIQQSNNAIIRGILEKGGNTTQQKQAEE